MTLLPRAPPRRTCSGPRDITMAISHLRLRSLRFARELLQCELASRRPQAHPTFIPRAQGRPGGRALRVIKFNAFPRSDNDWRHIVSAAANNVREPSDRVGDVVAAMRRMIDCVSAAAHRAPLQTRDLRHRTRVIEQPDRPRVEVRQ